jgi:ABC-type glycerol-3-phosphate transport system permease component
MPMALMFIPLYAILANLKLITTQLALIVAYFSAMLTLPIGLAQHIFGDIRP